MSQEDREVLAMANGEKLDAGTIKTGKIMVTPVWKTKAFHRMLSEVCGWTGFGAVMLICMLLGISPMWLAAPIFTGCFIWVAIQIDRFFRR